MSNKKIGFIAVACLTIGVMAGVAGAQAVLQHEGLHSGPFLVDMDETAVVRLAFDAGSGTAPARAVVSLLNENGTVVATQNALLQPGQSMELSRGPVSQPEILRFRADVSGVVPQAAPPRAVAAVEVSSITGQRRYVCSFDPVGAGGGRN